MIHVCGKPRGATALPAISATLYCSCGHAFIVHALRIRDERVGPMMECDVCAVVADMRRAGS